MLWFWSSSFALNMLDEIIRGCNKEVAMAEIRRIETERLIIESTFVVDKSKELMHAIHEADEFEWYFGVEETEQRLMEASIRRKWFYNIFDRERNFVGYLGFHRDGDDYEIEIYIIKEFRQRGYARESLKAMMREAFAGNVMDTSKEDITRIVSSVRKENMPSRALMESCGFEPNKDVADFCILFQVSLDDDQLGEPIFLAHYCITRERFQQTEESI